MTWQCSNCQTVFKRKADHQEGCTTYPSQIHTASAMCKFGHHSVCARTPLQGTMYCPCKCHEANA